MTKEAWPECVNLKMSAEACKDFIDKEIYDLFTDQDRYIRSIIIGKRLKSDRLYNAVVIMMNDNDMVEGRDGDGMVYYDFTWDGSGELATEEQQAAIPPLMAMEPTASLPAGTELAATEPATAPAPGVPVVSTATDDYTPITYDDDVPIEEAPLILLNEEVEGVTGSTIDEFITAPPPEGGGTTAPIAGGVLTDGTAENTPEGDAKIQDALAQEVTVESAGERYIEPIDCSGLTGESCCLLIKLKVRDHDINGNAIQCSLDYVSESTKKQYWLNHRGKKVHIFSNHNNMVSKVPNIVGDWPKGIVGAKFEEWLREAGAPPLIMQ